jgi:hypothetical protein
MNKKISIDEELLLFILDQEAKNIVGKICKRFELSTNLVDIKAQCKELLYEHSRDLKNQILNTSIHLINTKEQSKEKPNA